jgi:hypothetical protein
MRSTQRIIQLAWRFPAQPDEMIEYTSVAADPFSILTIVAAPAVLTNASSVLAMAQTIASRVWPIVPTP